jgi:hypothetical protein
MKAIRWGMGCGGLIGITFQPYEKGFGVGAMTIISMTINMIYHEDMKVQFLGTIKVSRSN